MRLVLSAQSTPSGSGALRCVSDFPRRQTYSLFTGKPNFSFGQKTHRKDPIAFHYKVLHGTSEEPKYGLALAQLAALPADVLSVATSPSLPFFPLSPGLLPPSSLRIATDFIANALQTSRTVSPPPKLPVEPRHSHPRSLDVERSS
jgi:hypothetical protein